MFKQGWKWLQTHKHVCSKTKTIVGCCRDKMGLLMESRGRGCVKFWKCSRLILVHWKDCVVRGFQSCIKLGSNSLLVIMNDGSFLNEEWILFGIFY